MRGSVSEMSKSALCSATRWPKSQKPYFYDQGNLPEDCTLNIPADPGSGRMSGSIFVLDVGNAMINRPAKTFFPVTRLRGGIGEG